MHTLHTCRPNSCPFFACSYSGPLRGLWGPRANTKSWAHTIDCARGFLVHAPRKCWDFTCSEELSTSGAQGKVTPLHPPVSATAATQVKGSKHGIKLTRFLYSYKTEWEHKLSAFTNMLLTCKYLLLYGYTDVYSAIHTFSHPHYIFVVTKRMHKYGNGFNSSPLEIHCSVTPRLMKQENQALAIHRYIIFVVRKQMHRYGNGV